MRRREFITLLGSAAAAWPLGARGQQGERMRRIGVLLPATADDRQFQAWVGAFVRELQRLGWTDGGNMRIEARWGGRPMPPKLEGAQRSWPRLRPT
jgi:putative tryptophan/tyrosine transport system substrate-binding protein